MKLTMEMRRFLTLFWPLLYKTFAKWTPFFWCNPSSKTCCMPSLHTLWKGGRFSYSQRFILIGKKFDLISAVSKNYGAGLFNAQVCVTVNAHCTCSALWYTGETQLQWGSANMNSNFYNPTISNTFFNIPAQTFL